VKNPSADRKDFAAMKSWQANLPPNGRETLAHGLLN